MSNINKYINCLSYLYLTDGSPGTEPTLLFWHLPHFASPDPFSLPECCCAVHHGCTNLQLLKGIILEPFWESLLSISWYYNIKYFTDSSNIPSLLWFKTHFLLFLWPTGSIRLHGACFNLRPHIVNLWHKPFNLAVI